MHGVRGGQCPPRHDPGRGDPCRDRWQVSKVLDREKGYSSALRELRAWQHKQTLQTQGKAPVSSRLTQISHTRHRAFAVVVQSLSRV